METTFKAGQKVIAFEKGWKKVETYFLAELDGVNPRYVCVNPSSLQEYEKDNSKCTLKRYERIEEITPLPIFKVGQKVKWKNVHWDNTWRYCVVTCVFPLREGYSYVIWWDSFVEDEFIPNDSRYIIELVTEEEIKLYFI